MIAPPDMGSARCPVDLSHAPLDVIVTIMQSMSLKERFTCALVCKAWAEAAKAGTRSIILRDRKQDLSCLQTWLENHGGQVEVLQLHECRGDPAVLTALPCPQLQDLLLGDIRLDSRVWSDLAAATKLTSVWLGGVQTASQQADMVSALTALPDLEQLTLSRVRCRQEYGLSDSKLMQKLTKLTALKLGHVSAAAALEHLGVLTKLQDLSLAADDWAAAGYPGLQELTALTRLELLHRVSCNIPPSVSQLTALQQLEVPDATPAALNKLSALTGLTRLRVLRLVDLSPGSPPLQLPGLQHLNVHAGDGTMSMSFLGSCTKLRVLVLCSINLSGPGSLVASTMLQHLELRGCRLCAAAAAADPGAWQQVFPRPGRLPHLTSLSMVVLQPDLQHADMECVVACCSSLQVLGLDILQDSFASALTRLSGLTSLILFHASDQQCGSIAQLTGLRELRVDYAREVFAAGLRQLAALEQLTSLGFQSLGLSSAVLREHMSDRLPGPCRYEFGIINKVSECSVCLGDIVWRPTITGTHITAVVGCRADPMQSHLHQNHKSLTLCRA